MTGEKEILKWDARFNIALGIASGLSYLNEGCPRRIIHRDKMAANILLTEDFEEHVTSNMKKFQDHFKQVGLPLPDNFWDST